MLLPNSRDTFSLEHVGVWKRCMLKNKANNKSAYQTNLTQNGYHLLPSGVVLYKQVSNIWTYFSFIHILLRSAEDISCSCQFRPLFRVVFPFHFWYNYATEGFDLRIKKKKKWISFNLEWGFMLFSSFKQPQMNRPK